MAQHDFVIDNGPGLAVRSDFNAALAALVHQNSGPVEPGTMFPGMVWLDTTVLPDGALRIRNQENSAWISTNVMAGGTFSTAITLSGEGRIGFTQADLSWVGKPAGTPANFPNRMVLNNAADGSGGDVFAIAESGMVTNLSSYYMYNAHHDGSDFRADTAGYAAWLAFDKTTGVFSLHTTNASVAAGAVAPSVSHFTVHPFSGAFETIGVTADFVSGSNAFVGSGNAVVLAPTTPGTVALRPNGPTSASAQATLNASGNFATTAATGSIISGSNGFIGATSNVILAPSTAGLVLLRPNGAASAAGQATQDTSGNFTITGPNATKSVAGPWIAPSDARLKNVHGDYEHGLAELLQVQPVRFAYKTSPDAEYIGMIAQDIEAVFPETVTLAEGEIDGETVNDLRQYDPGALTYALINAVKELSAKLDEANARIEALEGGT